jgi:molybdate transport system substrate-binding protein
MGVILISRLVALALLMFHLQLCAHAQERSGAMVYAAASLKEALDENVKRFETGKGVKVIVSYAASSALARQIEQGAPADIFISADLEWMDYLQKRGSIQAGTRGNLLANRLVLIAPADSKAAFAIAPRFPLAALLGDRRLAMADPDSVPAGKYGRAALQALEVWPAVAPKVARAENVRAALALVARGEAPFGIVYSTDAAAERKVRVVGEFAAHLHPPIVYPAALVTGGKAAAAGAFLSFLRSAEARSVWRQYGFKPGDGMKNGN